MKRQCSYTAHTVQYISYQVWPMQEPFTSYEPVVTKDVSKELYYQGCEIQQPKWDHWSAKFAGFQRGYSAYEYC